MGKAVTLRSSDGPAVTVIDATGAGGSAVTCTTGEGPGTVIEGFTITGGTGTFDGTRLVGGGMNNLLSSPTVTDCIFTGNTAGVGGGMSNLLSSPAVTGCTFTGNSAGVGGGMHNSNSSPIVTGCSFLGNTAAVGGGLYNEFSPAVISGCTFADNDATPGGGGAVFNGFFSASRLLECTFSANTAPDWLGGGVLNVLSNLTVHNGRFSDNSARQGGALDTDGGTVALFGCAFTGNEATEVGGGGVFAESATIQVINATFTGNDGPAGDALDLLGGTATLANSIVWNDSIVLGGGATLTATYSDIQGGFPGTGNIDQDPLFVDEPGGDLRLGAGSPCIDAANNGAVPADTGDLDGDGNVAEPVPLDLEGDPRFVDDPGTVDTGNPGAGGPIVDMGAHEFQLPSPCPADLDGDGEVGITDLLALLAAWGTDPGGAPDFDGDGSVGITDLLTLLAAWGVCP